MTNIKRITALLLALVMLLAASCSNGAETGTQTENTVTGDGTAAESDTVTETAGDSVTAEAPGTDTAQDTAEPDTETADTVTAEPGTTEPETTDPETTEPETTEPETTEPETTAPAATEPETTAPATTAPVTTAPETTAPETTVKPDPDPEKVYTTDNGLEYTAAGYSKESNGVFTIKKDFVMTFSGNALNEDFNRMTFTYTSGKPIKILVKYKQSGNVKTDDFYLEAQTNGTFSGLISSYLSGGHGNGLVSITVGTCDNSTAQFSLGAASAELVKVYDNKNHYIENSRFKIGIQLSWGGGINYIEDKTCPVSGLKNLINRHDTGRLVQQSYYGTAGNSQYTPGTFNGSKWTYNPVQGGDRYGNASRLIDISVKDNSVYIKSQPQDWSLNNKITPSYMENTYTLEDNCIRVDNRFVDFSGWEHRYTHQELPAFYTVSYLNRFTWYNGASSWTNDTLSYRDDLQFWGDARYASSCRFYIKESNKETWCAWTSSESGFGVGLFVPNIDMFYAGKYNYNGSKDASNDATNYVAPLNTIKMVSFSPIEYSYMITTGSVEQIRQTFYENRDFADNASLHKNYTSMRVPDVDVDYSHIDFSLQSFSGIANSPYNTDVSYNSTQKALQLKVTKAEDPQVMIDYSGSGTPLSANDYKTLKIEYMIPNNCSQGAYICDLFLCTGNKMDPDGSERTRITFTKDGEYHTATVDLSSLPFWSGKINRIRFDYFDSCAVGDVIYVKSFILE